VNTTIFLAMKNLLLILSLTSLLALRCSGQEKQYRVRTVAFYNLENLFDTIDAPDRFDEDFTPSGRYRWDTARYWAKIERLAEVISEIGKPTRGGPPDILGVCEAENATVLTDLVNHELLRSYDYKFLHRDGPDERGIDVGLLYREDAFQPLSVKWQPLMFRSEKRFWEHTREQLVVHGYMDGQPLYLIVNHWPSRRGGELRSRPFRVAAAELNLFIIDSLKAISPEPALIAMGDFNDNPSDYALREVLKIKNDSAGISNTALYSPMGAMFKTGLGSLAYRDSWSLFDQIYTSGNLVNGMEALQLWKAGIHDSPGLTERRGVQKGYPLRTFTSGRYTGGYSDHFPVYAHFIMEVGVLLGDH
jgi:hypothetical protein